MRPTVVGLLLLLVLALTPPDAAASTPGPAGDGEAGSVGWLLVAAGGDHTCGLRTTGRLFCWGSNGEGQVGRGTATAQYDRPVEVAGGHRDWTSVSAGDEHTCGRRANGRLYCWGQNLDGELGDGTTTSRRAPRLVAGGITDWTSVSAGSTHVCGRRASGRLYCWGRNGFGQLGIGAGGPMQATRPRLVAGGFTDWTSVSAGGQHTCGRRANGRLLCWGIDDAGAVGNGPTGMGPDEWPAPRLVAGGFTDWTAVAAGSDHTCGRRATGRLYCWGQNFFGQVGDGTAGPGTDRFAPVLIGGSAAWTAVSGGQSHTCARRASGRLFCWGSGSLGELGYGGVLPINQPNEVDGAASNWVQVSAGGRHTCARTTARRLFCWGANVHGELGTGDVMGRTSPDEVVLS